MRTRFIKVVSLIVLMTVSVAISGTANAQGACSASAKPKDFSALDKVSNLTNALAGAGFNLQQGQVRFHDWIKDTCEGRFPTTGANNPWPNAYLTIYFGSGPADFSWSLRDDEAIVLVGQTPPAVAYFSYQTIMLTTPKDPNAILGITVGDATNIATIRTIGPDRANRPMVYIITGNRETEQRVRTAVLKAGYPEAIINVERIAPAIAPLSDGTQPGPIFYFAHRMAVPESETDLENYVKCPPYAVFRVTPRVHLAASPEPVPVLRVRGTGRTEMDLYPALQRLHDAILKRYSGPNKELDTRIWTLPNTLMAPVELVGEKPYVGLQRGVQVLGATRDTNYLASNPNFMLRDGMNEFVIVYGVNHQKTGKVTYSSVSIYADKDRWFGLPNGTVYSSDFAGTANQYLPGDPDADMLYVVTVARNCSGVSGRCMQVEQPTFIDISGNPYACPMLNVDQSEMFLLWRSYMEPATKVSPDDNELVYDRAIYFGPYFQP